MKRFRSVGSDRCSMLLTDFKADAKSCGNTAIFREKRSITLIGLWRRKEFDTPARPSIYTLLKWTTLMVAEICAAVFASLVSIIYYILRDPLPAKHLEEQTDTKTYDLWCRKGGGKRWQGISAISGARGAAERDEGGWKLLIFWCLTGGWRGY